MSIINLSDKSHEEIEWLFESRCYLYDIVYVIGGYPELLRIYDNIILIDSEFDFKDCDVENILFVFMNATQELPTFQNAHLWHKSEESLDSPIEEKSKKEEEVEEKEDPKLNVKAEFPVVIDLDSTSQANSVSIAEVNAFMFLYL